MSRFLDRIKLAETERQRIVAERQRYVAEADAALAARDREEAAERVRVEAPVNRRADPAIAARAATPRSSASKTWIAVGAGLASCLAIGMFFYGQERREAPRQASAQETRQEPKTGAVFELKLDRDLDAFAQRLKDGEKQ